MIMKSRKRRDPVKLRRLRQIVQLIFFVLLLILLVRAVARPFQAKGWPLIIFTAVTTVLTLVLGRVFCGWVCPVNTVLDRIRFNGALERGEKLSDHWRLVKYVLLILIVAGAIGGIFSAELDWMQSSSTVLGMTVIGSMVGIVGMNYLADLFWCRYLCPLGGAVALLSKIAPMRRIVRTHCNDCSICVDSCALGAIEPIRGFENDPGECTVCFDCLVACTSSSNGFAFTYGRKSAKRRQSLKVQIATPGDQS
jgi:ferredoxin-type protein NapH